MKKIIYLLCLSVILFSCSDDDETKNRSLTMNFTHHWDGTTISGVHTSLLYTNAHGEDLSIERLRYLISNVTLSRVGFSDIVFSGYNLVDLGAGTGLSYTPSTTIAPGVYDVSFTFGFNNEDNQSGIYPDLNSLSWNVPDMMGGGYHYMQLEGKFINVSNVETGYAYHAIRAVDNSGMNPTFPQDTFFIVSLGSIAITDDTSIEIQANMAEWFKNPNIWDLNTLNNMLMPNSAAQIMMYENGQNVFSLSP